MNDMDYKSVTKQSIVSGSTKQRIINKSKKFHTVKNRNGIRTKPKVSPRLPRKVVGRANSDPRTITKAILQSLSNSGIKILR